MKSGPDDLAIHQKIQISRRTAGLLLGSCLVRPAKVLASADPLTNKIVVRSQLSAGDPGRLMNVFAKAYRGEPITLGVIGGSITVGAFATTKENSYAGRLLTWWRQQFPRCEVRMVNAGVGGTGSMYGALRAGKDLLSNTPDFVVIEFAVNDNWTDGEAFEGLVRQILAQPNLPAVLLLFMMWEKGGNDQEMQANVGAHYQLPMVSFRDALWPEMAAGRLNWSDYIVDTVHPTDAGHAAAARFITAMCNNARHADLAGRSGATSSLPSPLHSDAFEHIDWRDAAALDPHENQGWHLDFDDKGVAAWNAAAAAGRIAFDWSGTGLVAVFADPLLDPRRIRFRIDGASFQTLDTLKQPKRPILVLAQDLTPGRHIVELVDDDGGSGRAAGQQVRLIGIAGIGLKDDWRR
ncbi:Lysophospholipase L1 [Bradyrhizobium lablabi]|uniref:Lysophospholipase L1 n=1 Tax=Bradyrhizobium lablabi TaxID=722472 RepID=A0A1M6YGF4_9BRAD|nr:SGNH/GDSL hydrolase family protein [Bradyrhizobium lablabi]SHL17069.1 Lysophospholipase L1 [Bradyrhizobium lablabi]